MISEDFQSYNKPRTLSAGWLIWGGLPQRFLFKNDTDKISYLSSVYDSIILKDIVERLGIKDIASFNKVLQYVLDTESREFSRDNVI